jgi:Protein of unknown function (DUF3303)
MGHFRNAVATNPSRQCEIFSHRLPGTLPRVLVRYTDKGTVMLFMVIEHFRDHDAKAVYARFRERGRLMSDEIGFVGSWVAADLGRCFQVLECDDVTLLQHWAAEWSDLIELEIVPVAQGKDTTAALAP